MKYNLRSKLSLSYILLAMLCILLLSIVSNLFLERQFRQYVIKNQERKNKEIVSLLSQRYDKSQNWDIKDIEAIGINALEQGLIIKLSDEAGNTVWDAVLYNNGMCHKMLSHMSENMVSRYPNWKGSYQESSYPIMEASKQIGSVQIGYYGPFYYNDTDLAFINALNRALLGVGIFSLLSAMIFGYFMARRLSNPLVQVTDMAKKISQGQLHNRSYIKSDIAEISNLADSINNLAENLQSQENLRKKLTADVAHELRTPLATLQSHMEAMIDGIWKADGERLKSCHEEIMRINRMVGDLEKLAKYENEKLSLNKSQFDVSELIRSIMLNFESEYKGKNISVEIQSESLIVNGDRDKISQVLINLISNALKYTPQGGTVEIITSQNDKEISITVKDNGLGISAEDLPYIFERFYRADKSRNRMTGGSGIGLTIVKAIVEAHGGNVSVQSKYGEGCEFTVVLPKY